MDELGGAGVADDRVERRRQRRGALGVVAARAPRRPRSRRRTCRRTRRQTLAISVPDSKRASAITGRYVFSSRMPWEAPNVTVVSLPKTRAATWLTDSHSTGLTLPGMIDDPACSSGSSSSADPADGPLASRRMSLAILVRATAMPRSPADASASDPWPPCWTIGLALGRSGSPVSAASAAMTPAANPAGALIPVPTAVPPSGSSPRASMSATDRRRAPASRPAHAAGLLPDRHRRGVHQVRPTGLDDVGEACRPCSPRASISSARRGGRRRRAAGRRRCGSPSGRCRSTTATR